MKIANTGSTYQIYTDDLKVYDELPIQTYNIRFNKMMGFYLEKRPDLEVKEKIYGQHQSKAEKVLYTFSASERNIGVILSGKKGIGKSLCGRLIAIEAIKNHMPVIVVDEFIPGIASFIDSIMQPAMFFFDEFDKTFCNIKVGENTTDAQASMLGLFDGLSNGKKLFVITCNETNRLSDYIVNRPGRFHYHFRFDYPSDEEMDCYLHDQLDANCHSEIPAIVAFAHKVPLNFDCLRAIAFELNLGNTLKGALEDLNIVNTETIRYDVIAHMKNGETLTAKNYYMDFFSADNEEFVELNHPKFGEVLDISFPTDRIIYDERYMRYVINGDETKNEWVDKEYTEVLGGNEPQVDYISMTQSKDAKLHYVI